MGVAKTMAQKLELCRKRALLERMLIMRRFEEELVILWEAGAFRSHYHLYIGQEATGAAAIEPLRADDRLVSTHRNHGHVLARGADPGRAFAEILGRDTGLNRGRAGTLHMSDPGIGFLHTSALVGGCIGLAVGGGYALQRAGGDAVCVAFFGDASLEEGISFEAMNIAALWSLPVLFICENNASGALGSEAGGFPASVIAATELTAIPATLGIPTKVIDGRDVGAVVHGVGEALAHCRAGRGPFFIEAVTTRWAGSKPLWPELATGKTDIAMAWNMAWNGENISGEQADWLRNQDPILLFVRKLVASGELSREDIGAIDEAVKERIGAARQFALDSSMPQPAGALDGVFG